MARLFNHLKYSSLSILNVLGRGIAGWMVRGSNPVGAIYFLFPVPIHPSFFTVGTVAVSQEQSNRGLWTTHPNQLLRFTLDRFVPLLPLCTFMAYYRNNFTITKCRLLPSSAFTNSEFCLHVVFVCFTGMWYSEWTAFSLFYLPALVLDVCNWVAVCSNVRIRFLNPFWMELLI